MSRSKTYRLIAALLVVVITALMLMSARENYEFATDGLYLLMLIPVIGTFYVLMAGKRSPLIKTSSISAFEGLPESPLVPLRNLVFVCGMLALASMIIAFARPQSKSDFEDVQKEGIDLVISMDVSASMLARDFEPNRLESSKEVAVNFVSGRENDRFALVLYEGESYTAVPLTADQRVVTEAIEEIESGLIEGGTAIGLGLATAVNRLKDSEAASKVIILLTDGVNNRGNINPEDAAAFAKTFGIRVYTIGVGKNGKAQYPVIDQSGRILGYQWEEVEIDEDLLKQISKVTDGQYFRATDGKKLKQIYKEIDQLERTKFNVTRYSKRTEEYMPFALAAFVFYVFAQLLSRTVFKSAP